MKEIQNPIYPPLIFASNFQKSNNNECLKLFKKIPRRNYCYKVFPGEIDKAPKIGQLNHKNKSENVRKK